MKNINLLIFFFIALSISFNSYSQIKIKYKIGEEIVTNVDILNEKNYLIFLRPELKKLSSDELIKISENSLIREIIKKRELNKIFGNIDQLGSEDEIKKNLFNFKKVKNEKEFLQLLAKHDIKYKIILDKIKNEGFWNELIFKKYNSLVKINKKKLKENLENTILNTKRYEYKLSEILFEINEDEKINNKYKKILNYAKINDFKSAAVKYSISNSSNKGGDIGWVKETLLSESLIKRIRKMKIGQITKPIKYPNGYLLLMINDRRKMKKSINFDEELKDIIIFERNRQLNQFSLLLYKKLKQNTVIDEY